MNSTSINPSSGFGQVGSVDLGSDPARTPNYLATKSNNNKPGTYGIGQPSKADDAACGLTWDRRSSL